MKRRKALKNIGFSMSAIVATPGVIALLQACNNDSTPWNPVFFNNDESIVFKNMIDLMLPKTNELPGAIELNIHAFLDLYMKETYPDELQTKTKEGMQSILNSLGVSNVNPASSLKSKDYHKLLTKYLRASRKEREAYKESESETEKSIFYTLEGIRDLTTWTYKTSEEIGKHVLIYDPIPGVQLGCVPLEELTGGKAYTF